MTIHCPRCQEDVTPDTKPKGPHIGLYCPVCRKWLRWGNKRDWTVQVPPAATRPPVAETDDCPF